MLARQLSGASASSSSPAPRASCSARSVLPVCKVMTGAPATAVGSLTKEQVEQFHRDGYLAIPNHATKEECQELISRIGEILKDFDPEATRRSVFTTKDQQKTTNDYFLRSAGNISFFLEEKAFTEDGKLRQEKERSVNKIGHALHDLDPVFREFSRNERVAGVLRSLGYKRPLPVQSMYIFKQPHIGGEVVPHQDSTFITTEPLSCVGLWWALEDATKENGCLWAYPGVHKQGLLRRMSVAPDGTVSFDHPVPEYDLTKFVPIECEAGTLVLLQGENIHYSCENTSPVSRHSYSMHFVESTPEYKWPATNWAHRSADQEPWVPLYER